MKHEIDGAIIKAATKRTRNIACLKSAGHIYCSVNQCLMHRICLIECRRDKPCAYKSTMDNFPICTCPVRKEIVKRYGK